MQASTASVRMSPRERRSPLTVDDERPAPGGLGVLFCGTLEKRHPLTGAVYPRFVVLTASALHWFRRPENSELFGEPRGVLSLVTLRKASIVGSERREVCLEFENKSPLNVLYDGFADSTGDIRRIASAEHIRASSASSARVFGNKRNFICPTTATAIAWRAAIELAKRAMPPIEIAELSLPASASNLSLAAMDESSYSPESPRRQPKSPTALSPRRFPSDYSSRFSPTSLGQSQRKKNLSKNNGSTVSFSSETTLSPPPPENTNTTSQRGESGRFSVISASNASPSALAEYLTEDVAADMEDGYGDAHFLEALGHLVESSDEYALPSNFPAPKSPNAAASPVLSIDNRRKVRERSEIRFASVVFFEDKIIARNLKIIDEEQSAGSAFENTDYLATRTHFLLALSDHDESPLTLVLCDGTEASISASRLLEATGDDESLLDVDIVDPRFKGVDTLKDHVHRLSRKLTLRLSIVDDDNNNARRKNRQKVPATTTTRRFSYWLVAVLSALLAFVVSVSKLMMCALAALLLGNAIFCLFCRPVFCLFCRPDEEEKSTPTFLKNSVVIKIELVAEALVSQRGGSISTVTEADESNPEFGKFVQNAKGDEAEASRRWRLSRAWRRRERVDDVLREPQPFFDVIKDAYPHWLGGRSRKGELVYWERVGCVDAEKLRKAGVNLEALVRHYIFLNEWTWRVHSPSAAGDDSYQVVVLDIQGVRLQHVGGLRLEYLRACTDIAQLNYPERTSKYVVVNAPSWIPIIWRVVEPMLHPETRSRISIHRSGKASKDGLLDLIDPAHVPACYGGTFAPNLDIDKVRRQTPEELNCKAFVDNIIN